MTVIILRNQREWLILWRHSDEAKLVSMATFTELTATSNKAASCLVCLSSEVKYRMGATLTTFGWYEPPEKFIRRVISEHCVVVFAKTQCPYSQMAKDTFAMLEVPIKVIDIDKRSDGDSIQDTLLTMTKVRTVT